MRWAETITLIIGIPEEPQRLVAIRSALGQWSATAPVEAAAWLDAHIPDADTNILWAVVGHFCDPLRGRAGGRQAPGVSRLAALDPRL